MNNDKVNSLIRFAIRSRGVCFKQTLEYNIYKGRVHLILVASDISDNSLDEVENIKKNVKVITYLNKSELGELFSKDQVAVCGILNVNLAKEIKRLLKEEEDNA